MALLGTERKANYVPVEKNAHESIVTRWKPKGLTLRKLCMYFCKLHLHHHCSLHPSAKQYFIELCFRAADPKVAGSNPGPGDCILVEAKR